MMDWLIITIFAFLTFKVSRALYAIQEYGRTEGAMPRRCLIGHSQHWGNGIALHVWWVAFVPVHHHSHYHSTMLLD